MSSGTPVRPRGFSARNLLITASFAKRPSLVVFVLTRPGRTALTRMLRWRELECGASDHALDARLRRVVEREERPRDLGRIRRDADDRSASTRGHERRRVTDDDEGRDDVAVQVRRALRRARTSSSGFMVPPPTTRHRDGEAVGQRCRGCETRLAPATDRARRRRTVSTRRRLRPRRESRVWRRRRVDLGAPHDQHRRAVTREPRRRRAADAAAPSRHQRGLSGQRLLHHVSLPSLGTVRRTGRRAPGSHIEAVPSSAGARPGSRRGPACAGS